MPYWLWLVADLPRRDDDRSGAAATLAAAQASAAQHDDVWWLPEVLRTRAALEPTAEAVATLERAAALAAGQCSAVLLARCRADLAALTGSDPGPAVGSSVLRAGS